MIKMTITFEFGLIGLILAFSRKNDKHEEEKEEEEGKQ